MKKFNKLKKCIVIAFFLLSDILLIEMVIYMPTIEIHREDLEANWKLLSNGDGFFKIDPLK